MLEDQDDRALMQRFQDTHDQAAFAELFARNRDPLFRFLVRMSGSEQVAEDLSQHAWMRLIELARARRYDPGSQASFRTFLFTLARNRYIDEHVRKLEATMTEPLGDTLDAVQDPQPDLLDALDARQSQLQVRSALQSLRIEQREVLALWMHGFELGEVARITGSTWETIVARKKHALKRLAQAMRATTMADTA
jgi:RNA polymerase sigma factor (sigma-70 family)